MRQRTKVIAIKDMPFLYLAEIYCFLLDIVKHPQFSSSDELLLNIKSPNAKSFPEIMDIISYYPKTDWREDPIKYLVNRDIIDCKGPNIPLYNPVHYRENYGVELAILNRSQLTSLLKQIATAYKSKTADGRRVNTIPTESKNTADTENQFKTPPPLTEYEKRKYANDYPRKDIIKFTNMVTGKRYVVLVNNKRVKIEPVNFVLLLYFAIASKQEKNLGEISYNEVGPSSKNTKSEEIVLNSNHLQNVIGKLKMDISSSLEQNEFGIIDNSREGRYRLTTMPTRIKTNLKWLRGKYRQIKTEVIKERQGREDR